jgi:hypothetical protein
LIALLSIFRFLGSKFFKEKAMGKKLKNSISKVRVVNRCCANLVKFVPHFIETVWAVGAGVAASVVSTSTH